MVTLALCFLASLATADTTFTGDFETGTLAGWSLVEPWPAPCPWLPHLEDPSLCEDTSCICQWVWDSWPDGAPCVNLIGLCP
jgi:hypothetical protein